MKKSLMILTVGLFFGTIGYTSTATAGETIKIEKADCKDDCKKECCKDKKGSEAKACASKEGKKACCSSKKGKKKN